jgi:hypothetical protein
MPFKRKTLSELRTENRQFMQAELEGGRITSLRKPESAG